MSEEIKKILKNIIHAIMLSGKAEEAYFKGIPHSYEHEGFNYYHLADAAGNHLFDEYPELYDLTKIEGHKIREFFQTSTKKDAYEVNSFLNKTICNFARD